MKSRSVLAVLLLMPTWVLSQITVNTMPATTVCGSPTLSVDYAASGTYNVGNVFSVELSDAAGSFTAPTIIGSLSATGSGSIECAFPAGIAGGAGQAIRVVASDPLEFGTPYVLPLTTVVPPNAGNDAVVILCSTDPPFDLLSGLGGLPDVIGIWNLGTGFFDPATDVPGIYTYHVSGTPPCADDMATLSITVVQAPDPGTNGSVTVCSSDAPFVMFSQLGGSPNAGGVWTSPNGDPVSGVFIPGINIPGIYVYTLPGNMPCGNGTSTLLVSVNNAPDAGTSITASLCSNEPTVDMLDMIGGEFGGTWTYMGQPTDGVFDPSVDAGGVFIHTAFGSAPCTNATASLTIVLYQAPNAGTGGSLPWCTSAGAVDLFSELGGTPDAGGTWMDVDATGELAGNIFNAPVVSPGSYDFTYVVNGIAPCASTSATLTVTVAACMQAPPQGNFATE